MNAWLVLDLRLGGCMFVDSGCLGCAFAGVAGYWFAVWFGCFSVIRFDWLFRVRLVWVWM